MDHVFVARDGFALGQMGDLVVIQAKHGVSAVNVGFPRAGALLLHEKLGELLNKGAKSGKNIAGGEGG